MGWILAIIAIVVVLYQTNPSATSTSDTNLTPTSTDGSLMSNSSLVSAISAAITRAENVASFHNNPMALTAAAADQVGATYTPNTTGGVVVNFPTLQDGINAGQAFIQQTLDNHPNLTLAQWIARYINGPNDPSTVAGAATGIYPDSVMNYISTVASSIGASASDTIASLTGTGN